MSGAAFIAYPIANGLLADWSDSPFPSRLHAWDAAGLTLPEGSTYFGFVHERSANLQTTHGPFELREGMYFSITGPAEVSGSGRGVVIERCETHDK